MGADDKLQDPSVEPRIHRGPALVATAVALAFELGVAAYGFSRVPLGARVAIRWDAVGHPYGYADAIPAFLLIPALTTAISALLAVLPSIEPRRRNLQMSSAAYTAVWISILFLMAAVHGAIVFSATGVARSETLARLAPAVIGVFMAVVGNYLGKVRSNFFIGIRTPWTLSSERSWNRTHRLGGRLFVAVGLTAAATSVFPYIGFVVLAVGGIVVIAILLVYSYVEWSRDPAKLPLGRAG
jgi:uncharacterized membrane protein